LKWSELERKGGSVREKGARQVFKYQNSKPWSLSFCLNNHFCVGSGGFGKWHGPCVNFLFLLYNMK